MVTALLIEASHLFEKLAGNGADVRSWISPKHSAYGIWRVGVGLRPP